MKWLLLSLLHGLLIGLVVFLLFVVEALPLRIAILVGGGFFAWRSLNNPDFVFRRLARTCVAGALTAVAGLAVDFEWIARGAAGDPVYEVALAIGAAGGWLPIALLAAAVSFALLEVVRLRLAGRENDGAARRPLVQLHGEHLEVADEGGGTYRYMARLTVRNRNDEACNLTGARVLLLGLWPAVARGAVGEGRLAFTAPPGPEGLLVAAGTHRDIDAIVRRRSRLRAFLAVRWPGLVRFNDRFLTAVTLRLEARQAWARAAAELDLTDAGVGAGLDQG